MNKQVFDNFPKVKCEECECYWNNQCDGVPEGDARNCTAYRATKSTDIPKRIKQLEERVSTMDKFILIYGFALILTGIFGLLN